jgi:CBS domain-containing protein
MHTREAAMLAVDVMTSDVATIGPETSIAAAVNAMVRRRISGLPVVSPDGEVVGMLTEGDLLRRIELATVPKRAAWLTFLRGPEREAEEYVRTHTHTVSDVMTPTPVTVDIATPLREVVALMERHRIRRVPVLRAGKLVGIVSRADLMRALANAMAVDPVGGRPDADIRADILAELKAQDWTGLSSIRVEVDHGIVVLSGIAQSDSVRLAIRAAAENVPGVLAVQSGLDVEPPMMAVGV